MSLSRDRFYGYGWVLGTILAGNGHREISFEEHAGGGPGINTLICRLEGGKKLILLLSNVSQSRIRFIREQLVNILYGGSYIVPKSLSMELASCKTIGEIKALLKNYETRPENYYLRQDAINGVGFTFMLRKQPDLGLTVLEYNARQFPESPFVYESLAEACLLAGKRDQARKNLKKLLKLDSSNRYARKKLAQLDQSQKGEKR
jgi:hypothetical protein